MPTLVTNTQGGAQVRDLVGQLQSNCDRLNEIADLCVAENRTRTEAEEREYQTLMQQGQVLRMRIAGYNAATVAASRDLDALLRENLGRHQRTTFVLRRDAASITTAALADTGVIPVAEQDMLDPIRTGLIWDKVGIRISRGNRGSLRWPSHSKAVASWADEGERVPDTKVDFDALTMDGKRIALPILVTREALEDSEGVVEAVIRQEAPAAVIDLVNETVFATTDKVTVNKNGAATEVERKVKGPFCGIAATNFAGAVPTRKELLQLKAKLIKGIGTPAAAAWVMTEDMAAELADTRVDEGSGRFLYEDGKVLGWPVFTTDAIGQGNIGLGDFSYCAAGFFGTTSMIVDPYTEASSNSVRFVLNDRFGLATLRKEAFVLGKAKA